MNSAEVMARYGAQLALFGAGSVTGSPLLAGLDEIAAAMVERATATVH
jgi:hypothetical protein